MAYLGVLLEPFRGHLGVFFFHLGPFWGLLGLVLGQFGASWVSFGVNSALMCADHVKRAMNILMFDGVLEVRGAFFVALHEAF